MDSTLKRVLENWHSPWLCGQGTLASILEALKTPFDSSPQILLILNDLETKPLDRHFFDTKGTVRETLFPGVAVAKRLGSQDLTWV